MTTNYASSSFDLKLNAGILGESKHESIVTQLFGGDQHKMRMLAGGSVLNTIRFAQWVFDGLPDNSGQTVFLGSVGEDPYADLLLQQTIQDKVNPVFVKITDCSKNVTKHTSNENTNQLSSKNDSNVEEKEGKSGDEKENNCALIVNQEDVKQNNVPKKEYCKEKKSNALTQSDQTSCDGNSTQSIPYSYQNSTFQTGVCVALNTKNGCNRSMLAFLGAARALNADHVKQQVEHVQLANALYTSGFLLGSSADAVWELIYLRRPDQLFAFNLSAEYVCHVHGERLWQLLPHLDLLFCNSEELFAFAIFNQWQVSLIILDFFKP